MLQNCRFRKAGEGLLVCGICNIPLVTHAENAIRRCGVEAEDPPERCPDTLPCVHRGEVLRNERANLPATWQEAVSVFTCERSGECTVEPKLCGVHDCLTCKVRDARGAKWIPEFAPVRRVSARVNPWEGVCVRKPWEYDVAVMIPVLDSVEMLPQVVELLRLQTLRPYIILVDTGSLPENFAKVESLRAEDVEVHALRLNGFEHSSQSVAMACDVGFAVCQSRFLFLTHTDCFLRSRTVLEEFAELCQDNPVVGYQISPRQHQDWRRMCGHTATMVDMDAMHEAGVTWNFRRLCRSHAVPVGNCEDRPNWPDTEIGFNYLCWEAGIEPLLIGTEGNCPTLDEQIDHCRSFPSQSLYAPSIAEQNKARMAEAVNAAKERIAEWKAHPVPEVKREWRRREVVPKPLPVFSNDLTR